MDDGWPVDVRGLVVRGLDVGQGTLALGVLMARSRAIPARVKRLIERRSDGRCEAQLLCRGAKPYELHHRRRFSKGGRHTTRNLVALCRDCHHVAVHGGSVHEVFAVAVGLVMDTHPKRAWNRWKAFDECAAGEFLLAYWLSERAKVEDAKR